MSEAPPTFGAAARIFWAILWRSVLIGTPTILVFGLMTAMLFSSLGNDRANIAADIVTILLMIPIQISCIQLVIGKSFGKYKLVLLSTSINAA